MGGGGGGSRGKFEQKGIVRTKRPGIPGIPTEG